ncbi:MAG: response regulator [Phycisphaerales bacterium]|jgi:CheY-like chemotaxis protein
MQNSKPILLVEDDSLDVMTVKRALKDLRVTNELVHAGNGEEALEYLKDDSNKKPYIVLSDLNMPKMDGIEFLKTVKSDETLKNIPVVVLTTSKAEDDIAESFKLGVDGYMVKSSDYDKFLEIIRAVTLYWILSELPPIGN